MTGPRAPEPNKEILNIEEAAQLLGVSTKTFAKVLREGEIPGRKIGREWKFSRQALIDWVAQGRSRDFFDAEGAERREAARMRKLGGSGRPTPGVTRAPGARLPLRSAEAEMSVEED